jgi:uncharacterized membrane protein
MESQNSCIFPCRIWEIEDIQIVETVPCQLSTVTYSLPYVRIGKPLKLLKYSDRKYLVSQTLGLFTVSSYPVSNISQFTNCHKNSLAKKA